jgi:hypothetical protein
MWQDMEKVEVSEEITGEDVLEGKLEVWEEVSIRQAEVVNSLVHQVGEGMTEVEVDRDL